MFFVFELFFLRRDTMTKNQPILRRDTMTKNHDYEELLRLIYVQQLAPETQYYILIIYESWVDCAGKHFLSQGRLHGRSKCYGGNSTEIFKYSCIPSV